MHFNYVAATSLSSFANPNEALTGPIAGGSGTVGNDWSTCQSPRNAESPVPAPGTAVMVIAMVILLAITRQLGGIR